MQERLRELFPPVTPDEAAGLEKIADRLWRVRRVLGSRVHQERLMFYEALFAAAAEPHGIDIQRIVKLGELMADALDLREETLPRFALQLRRRQGGLTQALGEWREAMNREWTGRTQQESPPPRERSSARMPRLESGLDDDDDEDQEERNYGVRRPCLNRRMPHAGARSTPPPRLPALSWGEWLARRFAENGWKLPEGKPEDRRMHDWLVRAAVLGGDHVRDEISAGLEQAIGRLARTTWERLGGLRERLERATTNCTSELEAYERRPQEAAPKARSVNGISVLMGIVGAARAAREGRRLDLEALCEARGGRGSGR